MRQRPQIRSLSCDGRLLPAAGISCSGSMMDGIALVQRRVIRSSLSCDICFGSLVMPPLAGPRAGRTQAVLASLIRVSSRSVHGLFP